MHSDDPTYPFFPILAFIGFLLSIIPLSWHIQAWNAGTCAFMAWTAVLCLIEFINSIIWSGNVNNVAPIWCDISTKLAVGASVGIPAATLCISRRLYSITSVQAASMTHKDKQRIVIQDICIAVGIPILIMILHVVVQAHRFDILEDIGCVPVIYNTLPAYFLYYMWPVALGLASFIYSGLTLRSFWQRRIQFNQLASSNSSMNTSRYVRLMLLALVDMMFTVPLGIYTIYIGTKGVGLAPWISWEDTHFNFARVKLVPALFWRSDPAFQTSVELTRWLPVFCAFLFFGLFGFASEAQKHYRLAFWWVAKRFGFKPTTLQNTKASIPGWNKIRKLKLVKTDGAGLPVYTPRSVSPPLKKQHLRSLSSSLADSSVELNTYATLRSEKSMKLSSSASNAPPEYFQSSSNASTASGLSPPPPSKPSGLEPGNRSLRTVDSNDRIYVSEDASRNALARTPSPPPFTNLAVPPRNRSSPASIYPSLSSQPTTRGFADVIHVTIHTHSESTETL